MYLNVDRQGCGVKTVAYSLRTDRHTHRQTDRQTDRHTYIQTDRRIQIYIHRRTAEYTYTISRDMKHFVCFVFRFDFPIFKRELGENVPEGILCADSLPAFKELDKVMRSPDSNGAPLGRVSYSLSAVYQRVFHQPPDPARQHTAEGDCDTLLRLIVAQSHPFILWCDRNACRLSDIAETK